MSELKELAGALTQFQAAMPVLRKTGRNFQKGNAATIGDIVSVAKKGAQFGLSFSQRVGFEIEPQSGIRTAFVESVMMHHPSGQTITSGQYPVDPTKPNDPAAFGAAVTYAKKNSLQALYGIADHDDDDIDWDVKEENDHANEAPKRATPRPDGAPSAGVSSPPAEVSLEQELAMAKDQKELLALFNRVKPTDPATIKLFSDRKGELSG